MIRLYLSRGFAHSPSRWISHNTHSCTLHHSRFAAIKMKLSLATTSFLVLVTTPSLVEGTGLRHRLLAESPTLAAIEARGKLLCGSSSSLGMTWFHDDGTVDGLQVDLVSGFSHAYMYVSYVHFAFTPSVITHSHACPCSLHACFRLVKVPCHRCGDLWPLLFRALRDRRDQFCEPIRRP